MDSPRLNPFIQEQPVIMHAPQVPALSPEEIEAAARARQAAGHADAARRADNLSAQFLRETQRERLGIRDLSGLSTPEAPMPQDGVFAAIRAGFDKVDVDYYCKTEESSSQEKAEIKKRHTTFSSALKRCKRFVQKIKGRLDKGELSDSARKEIAKEAKNRQQAVSELSTPGQEVLFAGSYGNKGSFTQRILHTTNALLSVYFRSVPTEVRSGEDAPIPSILPKDVEAAFTNGNADLRTLIKGVALKDPRTLSQQTQTIDRLFADWKESRILYYASFVSHRIGRIREIVEAHAATEVEENLSPEAQANAAFDRAEKVAAEVGQIAMTLFNRDASNPYLVGCKSIESVITFFVRQAARIGLFVLQREEGKPLHLLRIAINEALTPLLSIVLEQLPEETRDFWRQILSPENIEALCEEILFPPTGDLHTKYTYRGQTESGEKLYDVQLCATGPLLKSPFFQGKWPLCFHNVPASKLSTEYFQGLLQHTLGAEIDAPFTPPPFASSASLVEELLSGALSVPVENSHVLTTTSLTEEEIAFLYSVTSSAIEDRDHPQVKLLLGQYAILKKLSMQRMHEIGDEGFNAPHFTQDEAFAMRHAAGQIVDTARKLSPTNREMQTCLPMLEAFYQEMVFASQDAEERLKTASIERGNLPSPIHFPRWLSRPARPLYSGLKTVGKAVGLAVKLVPAPTSWKQGAKNYLRENLLHLSAEELTRVCAEIDATFAPDQPLYSPKHPILQKLESSCQIAADSVVLLYSGLYHATLASVSFLISQLPAEKAAKLRALPGEVEAKLQTRATELAQKFKEKYISLAIRTQLDAMRTQYHELVETAMRRVRAEQPLSFSIPQNKPNGTYRADQFAAQLEGLCHFVPLNEFQLRVENHQINLLNIPGLTSPVKVESRQGMLRACLNENGKEWMLCQQQKDPRLTGFQPYLLLEDAVGNKRVYLKNIQAPYRAGSAFAEKYIGKTIWNEIQSYLPVPLDTPALMSCHFIGDRLTSNDPAALLYMIQQHLLQGQDDAAYACYEDFQKSVYQDVQSMAAGIPKNIPTKFMELLLPLLVCRSETGNHIRLGLFGILEEHHKTKASQAEARNPHFVSQEEATIWALILADSRAVDHTPAHPRFPGTLQKSAQLRGKVKVDVVETLTPHIAPVVKTALEFSWRARENSLSFRMREKVIPAVTTGIGLFALKVPQLLYAARRPLGLLNVPGLVKGLPEFVRQNASAHLSLEEKAALKTFFTEKPPKLPSVNEFPQKLTEETIKTYFWHYYDICWNASYAQNDSAADIQVALALLEQEELYDSQAATLIRLLATVVRLGKTGEGRGELGRYYQLQQLLALFGDQSDQEIKNLIERLNHLIETPFEIAKAKTFNSGAVGSIANVVNSGVQIGGQVYGNREAIKQQGEGFLNRARELFSK